VDSTPRRTRVVLLRDRDCSTGAALADALRAHGCTVDAVHRDAIRPGLRFDGSHVDLVLGYGPHNGSMLGAAATVDRTNPAPLFIWWLLENLASPRVPSWILGPASAGRLALDRLLMAWGSGTSTGRGHKLQGLLARGQRFRLFGETRHLQARRLLDGLFVGSFAGAELLAREGVAAVYVPFGYHPVFGRDLRLERDIDVVFLGRSASRRRVLWLERIRRTLGRRGIRLVIFDGGSRYIDGEARTHLLNRSKIVLNILKAPHDSTGHRFLLAAANKALMISEPVPATPLLEPGRHYVAASLDQLADVVETFVHDEVARRRITDAAYGFVTEQATLVQMVACILRHCDDLRRPVLSPLRAEAFA